MKSVNIAVVTALLSASIGASSAFAQAPAQAPTDAPKGERAHKMHERMKAADKDGDGRISRAEAAELPRLARHFDEIDTNKDGFITKEEMRAHRAKRGERGEHKQKQI